MSTSPFDTLLDFGDSSPANNKDDFDPFGPSETADMKGGGGENSLLDLGFDTQISSQQNGTSLKVNSEFSANNTNPLYELSSGNTNMSGSDAFNPLYEQEKTAGSNPLYEFLGNESANGHDEELVTNGNNVDLLGITSDDSGVTMETGGVVEEDNLVSIDTKENLRNEYIEEQQHKDEDEEEEEEIEEEIEEQQEEANDSDQEEEEDVQDEDEGEVEKTQGPDMAEKASKEAQESDGPVQNSMHQNGYENDEGPPRDPNITRESKEKEEIHFEEMNSVRQRFESGKSDESDDTPRRKSVREEYDEAEGGEYENVPVRDPNVVREGDEDIVADLPEVGKTKSLLQKFQQIESTDTTQTGHRPSPPKETGPVEYVTEPRAFVEKYEGKSETGIFESQQTEAYEGVVKSGEKLQEDVVPESGYAKNIASRYAEIDSKKTDVVTREKKELTPDRSGKVEYVSEPRAKIDTFEGKSESGVFESKPVEEEDVVKADERVEEVLPEKGMAKNLLSKFKEIESEVKNRPPPSPSRRLTPDRSGKVEYVSEPRGAIEKYEPKAESGVFESKPVESAEVIRSEDQQEDVLPEKGMAKNVRERFLEIQRVSASPETPPRTKQFTPPREGSPGKTIAGVLESTPAHSDLPKYAEVQETELPEQGMAKNLVNRFKQFESQSPSSTPKTRTKEITPPREAGVYENIPTQSLINEEQKAESGVLESKPQQREDIARESDTAQNDLPEEGFTKNLASKWKQLESESAGASTKSASPRYKEFTPPREDARVAETRGLLSPKSPEKGSEQHVKPQDLPGQYQEQTQPVLYENQPSQNEDIAREDQTDWTEGMPSRDTTKNLLNKFKSIQEQAKSAEETPKPVSRKGSTFRKDDTPPDSPPSPEYHSESDEEEVPIDNSPTDKGLKFAVQTEKCAACQETVYAMEKMEMNKMIYHKGCFKCSQCSARLTPKTFSLNEGVIYCTNHFTQLFRRKGNYDEGFGRQQYKKKWTTDSPDVTENGTETASA